MKKYLFYTLAFFILLNSLVPSKAFSKQFAVTEDGQIVLLKDDGKWEYSDIDADKLKVIKINEIVKDSLHYYIYNRPGILRDEFRVVLHDYDSFETNYNGLMENILYKDYKKSNKNQVYARYVRLFGRETAENMIWLFEHWDLWEKYCEE